MIDYETRYIFLREMLLFAKRSIDNELPSCALLELDKAARWIDSWDRLDELDKVEIKAPDHMFSHGNIK